MMILALLLAAAQPAPTPGWLIGRWVPVSDASRQDSDACVSQAVKLWRGDGSFLEIDNEGDWSLRGGHLVEQDDGGAHASRIVRLATDRLRMIDADGEQIDWRRCRPR